MFNLELAQKIIALLKQRQFKAPGLVVRKWRRIHDLENIPDGAACLIFNRADDKTHVPKPEEVLMWLRDGKINPRSVFLATDSYDDFLSLCSGDTYQIVDLQDIDNCEDADGNECGFVVEVQGLKFDVIDMMAPKVTTAAVPREFKIGDKVRIVRKHERRHEKWNNSWPDRMTGFVGGNEIYTICEICTDGIYFAYPGSVDRTEYNSSAKYFGWPPESLELVLEDKIVDTNPTAIVRDEVIVTAPPKKSTPRIMFVDD